MAKPVKTLELHYPTIQYIKLIHNYGKLAYKTTAPIIHNLGTC